MIARQLGYNEYRGTTMDQEIKLSQFTELNIGYYFFPPDNYEEIGSSAVGFNIFSKPTLEHFDPSEGIIPIINAKGEIEQLSVGHPWTQGKEYQIAAGQIEIHDRKDDKVEFFTFGGSVTIKSAANKTACLVVSPAPILHYIPNGMTQDEELLAEEVETLLAIRRAAFLDKKMDFDKKLASIPPMNLFISILVSIRAKYAHLTLKDSPHLSHFSQVLHHLINHVYKTNEEYRNTPPIQDLL